MLKFMKKMGGNALTVSNHITAIDGRVIVRMGEPVDQALIDKLTRERPPGSEVMQTFKESHHYLNFQVLLKSEKYSFLPELAARKEQLMNIFAEVQISQLIEKELSWLERYRYHYDHSLAVTFLATLIALKQHDDIGSARQIASCALTHDFGIVRVPVEIINKISQLRDDEIELIREHPTYSYCLLSYYDHDNSGLNAKIAYEHHENLKGTGYPRGCVPQQPFSQIIRICDIFDALISSRPFRPAKTPEQAMDILAAMTGKGEIQNELYEQLQSMLDKEIPVL